MKRFVLAVLMTSCAVVVARAQDDSHTSISVGASAIGLLTRATNTPQGRTLSEGYITQPVLGAALRHAWFHAQGTLDLEGLTLRRGELDLGAWGEGYVDRRHPHTYLHQVIAGADARAGFVRLSLNGGRGFAPFGSDDPMTRPFVSYPVDHHLAQILERVVVIGAVRGGPLTLETGIFNGDEPVSPSSAPEFRRFGDSWSMRSTFDAGAVARALAGAEVSASYANVKSPEYQSGAGLDQHKTHASLRFDRPGPALARYALVELARTTDLDRGRALYTFDAFLAEGAVCHGEIGVAARWERSDRPEEERLIDLFRTARPATDVSILGVTQWTTVTAAVSLPALRLESAHATPFIEVARIAADRTTAALFDPVRFYGANRMWRFSAGVRAGIGHEHGRMGRYGVASEIHGGDDTARHQHASSSGSRCFA